MVRLIRLALLVVMTFLALSLIIAIGANETGPVEKAVLAVGVLALILGAVPVQRLGSHR